ncbi:MAG: PucR family transcriptional regulator, purine catabolism regulatory protein [Thermomicrobiales bacterium]|jgi:purine catabolism regulator|nr:PucR family transcriptional regulator, purine catabolism regulatory protein [Thermomicrobiales bacterium]
MITVQDLIDQALPQGTHVVAGAGGLRRDVTWATRPRPSPPTFDHLSGGELVLLTAKVLQNLDERLTLEAAIRQLAGFKVSAVAFAGRIVAGAKSAADAASLPLLQLPPDVDLALLERAASDLISERRRDAQRRGHETGRRLMELAIAGEALPALARTLAEFASRPVVIEGRDGRLLAIDGGGKEAPTRETLLPLLERGRPAIATWLRSVAASSPAEPPTTTVELDQERRRLVAPIIVRDGLLGILSLLLPGQQELPEDAFLASRGAAACAVVLARERATAAARQELELNVLDEVLDGALRSEVSLLQQASRLGHDLEAPHVALVARLDPLSGVSAASPARLHERRWSIFEEALARSGSRLLWRLRHNQAEIVRPVPNGADACELASTQFDELSRRLPEGSGVAVSMGAGRVHSGPIGIRQSHQEAKQALAMGRKLHGPGRLTRFDDLGVYRLLFAAQGLPELRSFHDEALGTLVEYDRAHGAELLRTLEAFFAARCGPKEAAAILGVHRNTVLYRLDRVRELTGLDLDDADVRLRLHLALYANVALYQEIE